MLRSNIITVFFHPMAQQPGPPPCWGFTIKLSCTTPGRTALDEWSARPKDLFLIVFVKIRICLSRSHWPRGIRRGSAVPRFLGLRLRIPPVAWVSVSCECCVLSGRGFCVGLITRPEESYRVWCVWQWSWSLDNDETLAHWGAVAPWKNIYLFRH
jgi:hypothetical protein